MEVVSSSKELWKIIIFGCPKTWGTLQPMICLNIGTRNYYHFPCETNLKVVVLGVPIFKYWDTL